MQSPTLYTTCAHMHTHSDPRAQLLQNPPNHKQALCIPFANGQERRFCRRDSGCTTLYQVSFRCQPCVAVGPARTLLCLSVPCSNLRQQPSVTVRADHDACWWPGQTTMTRLLSLLKLHFPVSQSLCLRSQPGSVRTPSLSQRLRHRRGSHGDMWPKPFHGPEAHTAQATHSGVLNDLAHCLRVYHQDYP